jgi:hypothetical protein
MICPGCQRDNWPDRRYCGACGYNLEPRCGPCGFMNDRDDRFCGGCGGSMPAAGARSVAAAGLALHAIAPVPENHAAQAAPTPPTAHPRAAAKTQSMPWPIDELAGLFTPQVATPPESQALPEVGIAQDDLDLLFGGRS